MPQGIPKHRSLLLLLPLFIFIHLRAGTEATDAGYSSSLESQGTPEAIDQWSEEDWDALLLGPDALNLENEFGARTREESNENGEETNPETLSEKELEQLTRNLLNEMDLSPWLHEFTLDVGAGYHTNPLLVQSARDGSSLIRTSLEYLGIRLPESGDNEFFIYALGENNHYFNNADLENEYLALGQITYKHSLSPRAQWTSSLLSVYNDRVFGLSPATDEVLASREVIHQNSWSNEFEYFLSDSLSTQWTLEGERTFFKISNDDYWQFLPAWSLKFKHDKWDFEGGIQGLYRDYDDRPRQEVDGTEIEGPRLTWTAYEPYVQVETTRGNYQMGLRGAYRRNEDNGPGYHDSDRIKYKAWLHYEGDSWEWRIEGDATHYIYLKRMSVLTAPNRHETSTWRAQFELTRKIGKRHALTFTYDFEENQSTRLLDGYSMHQTLLSFTSTF